MDQNIRKIIKIFLASSEELEEERREMADLVCHLNYILHKQGIDIELVKWEYIDPSMETIHKQEEYNEQLKKCDLCMVLWWTKFGTYTKIELDTAYNEHKLGNNPKKLYVYFKNDYADQISEELKAFRDSFPSKYGHFSSRFNNTDSLKSSFLLQFMDYQNVRPNDSSLIEIRDSQVYISNIPMVNLRNVAFMGNNEEYKNLLSNIKIIRDFLSVVPIDDPIYSKYARELTDLENKQKEMEEGLWNTALIITRLSNSAMSERLQLAIDLFNKGDNKGAGIILSEEKIYKDADYNLQLIKLGEAGKEGLKINIDELKLKIKTLANEQAEGWRNKVCAIHEKIVELTEKLYGEKSIELADALTLGAEEFKIHAKYKEALIFNQRALEIRIEIIGVDHQSVANCYNNIGIVYSKMGDDTRALTHYEKSLEILLRLFGEDNVDVSMCYNNMGTIYAGQGQYERALKLYEKSLRIREKILDVISPNDAMIYDNVGELALRCEEYEKAFNYLDEALRIRLEVFGENHRKIASSYCNIGWAYENMGDFEHAMEYYEKSLNILLGIFGEMHPKVATSHFNIGSMYENKGDYARSLKEYEKALKIRLECFGKDHPAVAWCHSSIGMVYTRQGEDARALEEQEKALKILSFFWGENHPDVAAIYRKIAGIYYRQGKNECASEYLEKALRILSEFFDDDHQRIKIVKANINQVKAAMQK